MCRDVFTTETKAKNILFPLMPCYPSIFLTGPNFSPCDFYSRCFLHNECTDSSIIIGLWFSSSSWDEYPKIPATISNVYRVNVYVSPSPTAIFTWPRNFFLQNTNCLHDQKTGCWDHFSSKLLNKCIFLSSNLSSCSILPASSLKFSYSRNCNLQLKCPKVIKSLFQPIC